MRVTRHANVKEKQEKAQALQEVIDASEEEMKKARSREMSDEASLASLDQLQQKINLLLRPKKTK